MCSDNFWPFKCWFLWNVALWWRYQNVCHWLTIIPVQQHWLNKQREQLGSTSKSPVHFDWFLTITYKPLKTDLLCSTRLLINCIFFCGSRLSALFYFIFNSRSPGGKITQSPIRYLKTSECKNIFRFIHHFYFMSKIKRTVLYLCRFVRFSNTFL